MGKNRYLFCAVMFLIFVSVFSGTSMAVSKIPDPIIQNFKGDVAVRGGGSDKWEPVKEPEFKLKNGSAIRIAQGSAEISCPDGRVQIDTAVTNGEYI